MKVAASFDVSPSWWTEETVGAHTDAWRLGHAFEHILDVTTGDNGLAIETIDEMTVAVTWWIDAPVTEAEAETAAERLRAVLEEIPREGYKEEAGTWRCCRLEQGETD
jgi:hypothetical protein